MVLQHISTFNIIFRWYIIFLYSKISGFFSHLYIPYYLRPIIVRFYSWYAGCQHWESVHQEWTHYDTIFSYFTRHIKPRHIMHYHDLTAPVDCTVMACGKLKDNDWIITQVKGIDYTMKEFLAISEKEEAELKKKNLYFITFHLAGNACHRFRAMCDWTVHKRTHIPGLLHGLAHKDLFHTQGCLFNERVVLEGEWEHGLFMYTPIGSYDVGSIRLKFDKQLHTNIMWEEYKKANPGEYIKSVHYGGISTKARVKEYEKGIHLQKAEEIGMFAGGSAFVMIFEHSDHDFRLSPLPPQDVFYGQALSFNKDELGHMWPIEGDNVY